MPYKAHKNTLYRITAYGVFYVAIHKIQEQEQHEIAKVLSNNTHWFRHVRLVQQSWQKFFCPLSCNFSYVKDTNFSHS